MKKDLRRKAPLNSRSEGGAREICSRVWGNNLPLQKKGTPVIGDEDDGDDEAEKHSVKLGKKKKKHQLEVLEEKKVLHPENNSDFFPRLPSLRKPSSSPYFFCEEAIFHAYA